MIGTQVQPSMLPVDARASIFFRRASPRMGGAAGEYHHTSDWFRLTHPYPDGYTSINSH
jgi:hypothetical protein